MPSDMPGGPRVALGGGELLARAATAASEWKSTSVAWRSPRRSATAALDGSCSSLGHFDHGSPCSSASAHHVA